jgi:hypothetical protein
VTDDDLSFITTLVVGCMFSACAGMMAAVGVDEGEFGAVVVAAYAYAMGFNALSREE